tara:strand:+ start:75 stop:974 length:900 start_codon:yes stop_codon:yes gene_type:complete
MGTLTRFAPSPTGYLHLGHAYSAILASQNVNNREENFLLRIEDIDLHRCKPKFENSIYEDLNWLNIRWKKPVRRQSEHFEDYQKALDKLNEQGLIYPCFCTRSEIRNEIKQSNTAPHSRRRSIYPGTCKTLSLAAIKEKNKRDIPYVLRLNMHRAKKQLKNLHWDEHGQGVIQVNKESFGDVVLARKNVPTSYHLATTIDDHLQNVTLVVRGKDLFDSTHIHRTLQHLLDLATPKYQHHNLLYDDSGKRLAKRNKSVTLRELRNTGVSPFQLRNSLKEENIHRFNSDVLLEELRKRKKK